ncbi:NAD(P)H-dependent oxidoreductase [Pseudomonas sp. BN417]|uniref:NADPH-dependent FMN reductase n=1 Tax=Pseudomonas sp. BN417 TaxID=2567890 RepID=UPI002456BC70|nr:NAD(P)H-dependent oxidoreductase [Pseudomonas sp. BN417]MDH4553718.1 NAD(P)H-dependent oxidoreductase [Pseudomonas sp. BN417]
MSLKIALVAGSSRKQSQSAKVADYLGQRLRALGLCGSASVIDLGSAPLPLWPEKDANGLWADHSAILREADALVMVVPEWHGMASPAMKNFFVHTGYRELGHKPALLVGVSAGQGGAYPLSELRASSYKNCRVCYLPEQLIVRQVEAVMNGEAAADADDQRIRERADWALKVLASYGLAMRGVRQEVDMSRADFANGM